MAHPHRRIVWTVVFAAVISASGAAGQKLEVETHKDEHANFTTLKTYAWLPPAPAVRDVAPDAATNPTLTQEALGPHIVAAVDRQLARRGLTQVDRSTADVLVAYFASMTAGFSSTYLGEYYGYVTGWGSPVPSGLAPSTSMTIHERGTVSVDIVDRASNRAIWSGSVATRVHQERSLDERVVRIDDGVERMFRKFPIKARK